MKEKLEVVDGWTGMQQWHPLPPATASQLLLTAAWFSDYMEKFSAAPYNLQ
jgi:hypothetical protein